MHRAASLVAVCTVVVLLYCPFEAVGFSLSCCEDGNGAALSSCTCLVDDTPQTASITAGTYHNYHWILTNWTLISVPDEDRTSVTFEVAPCSGDVNLYIRPVELPFPTALDTTWNASSRYAINSISSRLSYAQFFVSVQGVADSTYTITSQVYADNFPQTSAGDGIVVTARSTSNELLLPGDTMSMLVSFNASVDTKASEYLYRVYTHALTGSSPCRADATAAEQADCILTTPCGVNATMEPKTDWFTAVPGANTTVEVPGLSQNQEYTFMVVAEHPNGRQVVYTGTSGTPTYQRVTAAASSTTIIIVACVAGAVILLLIVGIIVAKVYLNKAFRSSQSRLKRGGKAAPSKGSGGAAKSAAKPDPPVADPEVKPGVTKRIVE